MSSDFAKDTVYTIIVYTIIVDLKPSDLAAGLGNSMCKSAAHRGSYQQLGLELLGLQLHCRERGEK